MNGSHSHTSGTIRKSARARSHRGNAIILVIGILVLLVIIATAYVSRVESGRQTSAGVPPNAMRDDTHRVVAETLAGDIALALFVRPIDTSGPPLNGYPASANRSRLSIFANAERYGTDLQDIDGDGIPDLRYNFAMYQVVPTTNWPDPPDSTDPTYNAKHTQLPGGPGNPGGGTASSMLASEGNPMAGPGFGDCRWLRDLEPQRGYTDWPSFANTNFPLVLGQDVYTNWKHLTYIGRPDNAFRICTDISDVGDSVPTPGFPGVPFGALVTNLELPVEQWLNGMPFDPSIGTTNNYLLSGHHVLPSNFMAIWANRFGFGAGDPLIRFITQHVHAPGEQNNIPCNLYKLNDLDGDGYAHGGEDATFYMDEPGERPQDEFIPGTARWTVSRVLADSDGDGFTDSFWWLVPSTMDSSTRQILAISIVDNQGMLNANVATRFIRNDWDFNASGAKPTMSTRGLVPTELALTGRLDSGLLSSNWNVGFYDCPENHYIPTGGNSYDFTSRFDYTTGRWNEHLVETGLSIDAASKDTLLQRLLYWRAAASNPLSSDPTSEYTPFTLADEIELRMFYGNNYPFVYSRYESSVQRADGVTATGEQPGFLRSTINAGPAFARIESSEYEQQLTSRQAVKDQRHRLTLYNNVRNDIMAPWLWRWQLGEDFNWDGSVNNPDLDLNGNGIYPNELADRNIYEAGKRKTDLRIAGDAQVVGDFYSFLPNGAPDPTKRHLEFAPARALSVVNTVNGQSRQVWTYINMAKAWRDQIIRAMTDSPSIDVTKRSSYYGIGADNLAKTHAAAAGLAANMTQYHDADNQSPLVEAVPLTPLPGGGIGQLRMMGIEAQPFFAEAFIGHVYNESTAVLVNVPSGPNTVPYTNFNHTVVVEPLPPANPNDPNPRSRSTIVVVQLANPFDRIIDLSQYELSVFGQRVELRGFLLPATDEGVMEGGVSRAPPTAIFYAIAPSLKEDPAHSLRRRWQDFLDIATINPSGNAIATGTVVQNIEELVTVPPPPGGPPIGGGPGGGGGPPPPPIGGGPPDPTNWTNDREPYDTSADGIKLYRKDYLTNVSILVDRFDPPHNQDFVEAVNRMGEQGNRPPLVSEIGGLPGAVDVSPGEGYGEAFGVKDLGIPGPSRFNHWVQWVRVTRAWGFDINNNGQYEPNEKNPRYVFGDRAIIESGDSSTTSTNYMMAGNRYKFGDPPDMDSGPTDLGSPSFTLGWFTREFKRPTKSIANPGTIQVVTARRKPTFFNMRFNTPTNDQSYIVGFPDKGWYGQPDGVDQPPVELIAGAGPPNPEDHTKFKFPMRMLQKDGDFEQIGEVMNCWLHGHLLLVTEPLPQTSTALVAAPTYIGTTKTFSESMSEQAEDEDHDDVFVNRLRAVPVSDEGLFVSSMPTGTHTPFNDPRYAQPALPAAVRLMDAFVCDGPGLYGKYGVDDLGNAKGFDGTGTPGLININTAPPEVMRAVPNWYRLVHPAGDMAGLNQGDPAILLFNAAGQLLVTNGSDPDALLPRTMIPEALVAYREQYTGGDVGTVDEDHVSGNIFGPNYQNRFGTGGSSYLRTERGIAAIGETMSLTKPGNAQWDRPTAWEASDMTNRFDYIYEQNWRADFGSTATQTYSYNSGTNQFDCTNPNPAKPFWNIPSTPTPPPYQVAMRLSTNPNGFRDVNNNGVPDYVDVYKTPSLDTFDTTPPPIGPLQKKDGLIDDPSEVIDPTRRISDHIEAGPGAGSWIGSPTTAGDSSEFNALFSGASNLLTTRSDTFTVYFRIRTFRQNTNKYPAVWDATDPDYIIDDSRYVMLVDRSMVNKPGDKPRILYLEKVPN